MNSVFSLCCAVYQLPLRPPQLDLRSRALPALIRADRRQVTRLASKFKLSGGHRVYVTVLHSSTAKQALGTPIF